MSVILEFTIAPDDFHLGEVLSEQAEQTEQARQFELERVVPTGDMTMPFVWVTGGDHAAFEAGVRNHPAVKELLVLDVFDDRRLYRIEWRETPTDLINAIAAAGASILEARSEGDWLFRARFNDRERLSQFHADVSDQGLPINIDRMYTLSDTGTRDYRFDLTSEQHRALLLALRRGYFATPRETTLEELSDEIGITRQALSNRIRRGNEKVLRGVLLSSGVESNT